MLMVFSVMATNQKAGQIGFSNTDPPKYFAGSRSLNQIYNLTSLGICPRQTAAINLAAGRYGGEARMLQLGYRMPTSKSRIPTAHPTNCVTADFFCTNLGRLGRETLGNGSQDPIDFELYCA
jgi:hypothetical protein